MAKIAVAEESTVRGPAAKLVEEGDGWSVSEVVCTLGPRDRPFEEQHSFASIAIVTSGSFQYHAHRGKELLTPGSLLLISPERCFQCGHEHGSGDRCISFKYSCEFFDQLGLNPVFRLQRIPPVRAVSPLLARAQAAMAGRVEMSWEELGIELAALVAQLDRENSSEPGAIGSGPAARVSRVVRAIEEEPGGDHGLGSLAREAKLSPYHFLRVFQSLTGVTPHQYLLRARLRRAAVRLRTEPAKIVDIALESGFGDVSNFNRSFRAEFGSSPRAWRHAPTTRRGW